MLNLISYRQRGEGKNVKGKRIAALLICMLALGACGQKSGTAYIKSGDGNFYIAAPGDYLSASPGELNASANLEAYNKDKSACVIAIMEEKAAFSQVDFAAFSDYVAENIKSNYGVTVSRGEDAVVDSHTARTFTFETSSGNAPVVMWCYTVETEHYYGQLYAWTLKSSESDYKEELLSILLSFKEGQAPSDD